MGITELRKVQEKRSQLMIFSWNHQIWVRRDLEDQQVGFAHCCIGPKGRNKKGKCPRADWTGLETARDSGRL